MSTETESHALIYRSKCALNGIKKMAGENDISLDVIKGFELYCLLDLVTDELSDALELMGGDPDKMRENLKEITHPADKH